MRDPIAGWHAYMQAPTTAALDALLADDVVFQSPAVHTPQRGKAITIKYLAAAAEVLGGESFRYVGEWRAERSAVLEFACTLDDGVAVEGVDIIHWDDDGRIVRFKVMIRPLKALNAVVARMGAMLAR
ncbi:nuclear transport factor 2 family protein [Sphingomonas adhaesiva]|uniref:nuclear transport factor 2 family protein n=1 Tax=Sphingomonas adhaesiva TaxID=28212 RepID=UPI002FF66BE8